MFPSLEKNGFCEDLFMSKVCVSTVIELSYDFFDLFELLYCSTAVSQPGGKWVMQQVGKTLHLAPPSGWNLVKVRVNIN